ncbi:hypothetical protein QRX50_36700 [Amycolatopsis carbonis]|uniref:Uncharacterized protein n=1 Tax=Amycolatopsis carbonis TaxID=715471 RepID=A0A9Y2IBX7_9PSEU|nr:hypothetical protein [Amycolatopsis sp. 2-15]WIX76922.1 hypothetical protein QRX50_36700 [Amycolatopsis sp. 2-15]
MVCQTIDAAVACRGGSVAGTVLHSDRGGEFTASLTVAAYWLPDDAAWYVAQVRDPDTLRFTTERATLTVAEFQRALEALRRNRDAQPCTLRAIPDRPSESCLKTCPLFGGNLSRWIAE